MRACASPVVVMDYGRQPLAVLDLREPPRGGEGDDCARCLGTSGSWLKRTTTSSTGTEDSQGNQQRSAGPEDQCGQEIPSASRCSRRSSAGQGQTGMLPSGCRRCRRGRGRARLQEPLLCRSWQHKRWKRRSRRFQGSPVGQEGEAESLTRNVPCSTNSVKRVGREWTWRRQVAE